MRIDRNPIQLGSPGLSGAAEPGVGLLIASVARVAQACGSNAAAVVVATFRIHTQGSAMSLKWARREAGR